MNLRKSREEIPIWWRSDSSSKGKDSASKGRNGRSEAAHGKSEGSSRARTLKKWFPETEIDRSGRPVWRDGDERAAFKRSTEKRAKGKACPAKDLSGGLSASSVPSSRLSFVVPDSYSSSSGCVKESVCTSLLSSSSLSSDSSSSLTYSSCSSVLLTDGTSCTSLQSSSSCSFCVSSSSSYTSTLCLGSSGESSSSSCLLTSGASRRLREGGLCSGTDVVRAVSSFKKGMLTIQRLPAVCDIPLGPYSLAKARDKPGQTGQPRRSRIMQEIRKFQGWESSEKAFSGEHGLCSVNKKVVYSLSIYHIGLTTKETIFGEGAEPGDMAPRVTLTINNGPESEKRVQHSKEAFSQQGYRLSWGSSDQGSLEQRNAANIISFSVPIYQVEDDCSYFSLTFEGVGLGEVCAADSVLKRTGVILGTAFSPLPCKNNKWNISIPIYSCFEAETFLDSRDSQQLISNISPNTFKKLGKVSFTLSRREEGNETAVQGDPVQRPGESSSSTENELTREIRNQVLSCLGKMSLAGGSSRTAQKAVRKSVVSGEVVESILSSCFREQSISIKEKELELKEREIQIKEKELELQMKRLAERGVGQSRELGEEGVRGSRETQMERETGGSFGRDHSCEGKKLNYFRVKDKSSKVCNRVQLARQRRSIGTTPSLALRSVQDAPSLVDDKEGSRHLCRHKKDKAREKERRRRREEEKNADSPERGGAPREQTVYSPVQIPLLVNNLPVSSAPAVYTSAFPQNYLLYYPQIPSSVNKENSSVQTQPQVQAPEASVAPLKKPPDVDFSCKQSTQVHSKEASGGGVWYPPTFSPEALSGHALGGSALSINSLTSHSGLFSHGGELGSSSGHGAGASKDGETDAGEFLGSQMDQFSIDCGTILAESGVCSNSKCKYRGRGRMEYSKCGFTNTEIDNWKICQYCQMEMFPSLYFIEMKRPKFVEFFFDSSVPICFPSRQLVWPTSLHFLLAQFSSSCSEVRDCKTHDQILSLARKRRTWITTDILPNIAVIILAMKVFQHPALQQLLLTFSEREFFLLREYWIRHDPVIELASSEPAPALSNLGGSLIATLEQLRLQIQNCQKRRAF